MMMRALCLCFVLVGAAVLPAPADDQPAPPARPPIYDTKANGAKQVADAMATAKREHKHVLLQFGANWCGWCHKLHKLFETERMDTREKATMLPNRVRGKCSPSPHRRTCRSAMAGFYLSARRFAGGLPADGGSASAVRH